MLLGKAALKSDKRKHFLDIWNLLLMLYWLRGSVWMRHRKLIAWRQNSNHWTYNEWPWYIGAKRSVTFIALQSCIRLKAKHILIGEVESSILKLARIFTFFVNYFQITCFGISMPLNTNKNTCLTLCWSCLRYNTACHSVIQLWFWFMQVKRKKHHRHVG